MTSSNPYLERAKQGDPDAIAYLMRRSLQSKGIEVSAQEEGDTLLVTLEGAQPVNREAVVAFIRKGMLELDVSSLRSVQVDWRQQGSLLSEWTEEIVLSEGGGVTFGDSGSLSQIDDPMEPPAPIDSIDDMDLPDDGGLDMGEMPGMDPMGMDADGDMSGDKPMDLMDETSSEPEKKKASTSPIVLLLLLAALLGGGWYFYREGYFDSVIAQLPDPVRQYLPPSTGAVATDPEAPADPAAPEEGAAAPEDGAPAATDSPAPADGETPVAADSPAPAESPVAAAPDAPAASPIPEEPAAAAPQNAPSPVATTAPTEPPFNVGVREAIKASELTQTAQSPAEWSAVAQAWQAAVTAMKQVPETDANYATAQDRIPTYEQNLAYAQGNAQ
ncbi:MAG: hypothetical protein AAGF75_01000 [Cyanobacteria bacterium P01_H01_bin.130]